MGGREAASEAPAGRTEPALNVAILVGTGLCLPLAWAASFLLRLWFWWGDRYVTPTGLAFLLCVFGAAPSLAALMLLVRTRPSPVSPRRAGLVCLSALAGWIVAVVAGFAMYPQYPHAGPHEVVASMFIVPGVLSGVVAAVVGLRKVQASRRVVVLLPSFWAAICAGSVVEGHRAYSLPMRDLLPLAVTGVSVEEGYSRGHQVLAVEGPATPEQFASYVQALGLRSEGDGRGLWRARSCLHRHIESECAESPTPQTPHDNVPCPCVAEAQYVDGFIRARTARRLPVGSWQ